jgi:hypothetical protein
MLAPFDVRARYQQHDKPLPGQLVFREMLPAFEVPAAPPRNLAGIEYDLAAPQPPRPQANQTPARKSDRNLSKNQARLSKG